jgi:hypothetical protein
LIITFGIAFRLFLFVINIKNEVYGVLKSFLLFQRRYEDIKSYNILCLMLNLRFKISLILFFIGCEEGVNIVEEYDR